MTMHDGEDDIDALIGKSVSWGNCAATKRPTSLGKTRERLRVMDESDLSVLRERAESGDKDAVDQLIELAGEQGNLDELRRLSDQGNNTASEMLEELEE